MQTNLPNSPSQYLSSVPSHTHMTQSVPTALVVLLQREPFPNVKPPPSPLFFFLSYLKNFNPVLGFLKCPVLHGQCVLLVQLPLQGLFSIVHHHDERTQEREVEDGEARQEPGKVAPGVEGVVHIQEDCHREVQVEGCFK